MEGMSDNEVIRFALNMWSNYIQTGDVNLSNEDIANGRCEGEPNTLSIDQMKLIIRLEKLKKEYS